MKRTYSTFAIIVLVIFSSCSSAKIISDIDQNANFQQYKTYTWSAVEDPINKDYPQFDNSLNRARWRKAIDRAMQRQGYQAVDNQADLEVDFHLQFEHNIVPQYRHQDEMGSEYSSIGNTSIYQYDRGTVTIHMVDPKRKQIVWQGISTRIIDMSLLDKADANIQKAVDRLFSKLEAQKKKQ